MSELKKVPVENLNDFLQKISDFRNKQKFENGDNQNRFFFRGQENETWTVMPSVFRNDFLSIEGKIIQLAVAKSPGEFREQTAIFERLTKLQHYGLSTRLLDVTLNPLVAMYFACLPSCDEISCNEECSEKCRKAPQNGIIYYTCNYGLFYDADEVRILSLIASMDIENGIEIKEFLQEMKKYNMDYFSDKKIERLIEILQKNYFVVCNQDNDRLIRQSGAFLIPGAINIGKRDDLLHSIFSKGSVNLQNEFYQDVFIIDFEKKKEILDELDFYNINEATLFPELEHQMKYIKESNGRYVTSVAPFSKLEEELRKIELENLPNIQSDIDDAFKENLKNIISKALNNKNPKLIDNLFSVFIENAGLDWYRKEQIQANIRNEMFRTMKSDKQFRQDGKKIAEMILSQAIEAFLKVAAVSE